MALAEGTANDARARLEALGAERQAARTREAAAEQTIATLQSKLREVERRLTASETSSEAERERTTRLREEADALLRTVAEMRARGGEADEIAVAARRRERESEERAAEAWRELQAEREAHGLTNQRLEQAASECAALTARLGAQLSREREGRSAAERRATETSISLQAELHESQRELGRVQRECDKLLMASRGAAAAYCARVLLGRRHDALRSFLHRWGVAATAAWATDRVYEVEERARQHLMVQAHHFQTRLDELVANSPP